MAFNPYEALRFSTNAMARPRRLPRPFVRSLADRVGGRTVLITGASSGIGRQLASDVANAGATAIVVARRTAELNELCDAITDRGRVAYPIPADVSTQDGVDALADQVLTKYGAPDIVVNNAGRSIRRSIAGSEHRLHDYERLIQVNYLGAVGLTLRLLPGMRRRGSGHIIHSSSLGVQADLPGFSAYVGSKAAFDAFMKIAAVECINDGIAFSNIHFPLVDTEMIGPTAWDGHVALTVQQASDVLIDAIRRRPEHIGAPVGALATTGRFVMPKTTGKLLHRIDRSIPESSRRGDA